MTTPAGAVAGNASAAQDDARQREQRGGKQGFFQRKYGPLPGWGWAVLAGVGAIGYFWWRNRSQAQQAQAAADTTGGAAGTDTTGAGGAMGGSGGGPDAAAALQEEIDQLQGELAQDQGEDQGGGGTADKTKPVPKVTGLSVNPAMAKLKAAGFKSKLSEKRRPGIGYHVKAQDPAAGMKADPDTATVVLTIERDDHDKSGSGGSGPNPGGPRKP